MISPTYNYWKSNLCHWDDWDGQSSLSEPYSTNLGSVNWDCRFRIYNFQVLIFHLRYEWCIADCSVGGCSIFDCKRIHNNSDDNILDHVPLSILSKDLPLCLSLTSNSKSFRLYFWDSLVGDCAQLDCLLCCIACEYSYNCILNLLLLQFMNFVGFYLRNWSNELKTVNCYWSRKTTMHISIKRRKTEGKHNLPSFCLSSIVEDETDF